MAPMVASQFTMPAYAQGPMNGLQLASQLQFIRHPAGELAGYVGNFQPQRYNVPPLIQVGLQPGSAGLLQNYGNVGTGALYTSEHQHAAAFLNSAAAAAAAAGYQQNVAQQHFAHVGNPATAAAVSAMFGSSTAPLVRPPVPTRPEPPRTVNTSKKATADSGATSKSVDTKADTKNSRPEGRQQNSDNSSQGTGKPKGNETGKGEAPVNNSNPKPVSSGENVGLVVAPANNNASETEQKQPAEGAKKNSGTKDESDSKPESTATSGLGLSFFEPKRPSTLEAVQADLIVTGRFNEAVASMSDNESKCDAVEFVAAVGSAVPIPKALVLGPLKDKLNTPGFRSSNNGGSGTPIVPRDLVVAVILVWLWANHEDCFQQAFKKSGRTDVDPGCKWLIQAAVETAVRALALEIAESIAKGEGPFADSMRRGQYKMPSTSSIETDSTKKLEIHTATIVNKALNAEFRIDSRVDRVIPQFQHLIEYLDEARVCALKAKAHERTLLANLIARRATMTESFSHAYTSSIVRAGEVFGHDDVFDVVQDEEVQVCSLMPHDIITGEEDYWEDPCKPEDGFAPSLAGDDLMRRAHARAMIQKSLRKVQDRNHIRGGISGYGPYVDPSTNRTGPPSGGSTPRDGGKSPRDRGLKRRSSSFVDTPIPAGSGSAPAKSWSQYDPTHVSPPLEWNSGHSENTPYGSHRVGEQVRSLSIALSARSGEPRSHKKARRGSSSSGLSVPAAASTAAAAALDKPLDPSEAGFPKSTREIDWADIAGIFQSVELPRKSLPDKTGHGHGGTDKKSGDGQQASAKNIIAPYCRKFDPDAFLAEIEEEAGGSGESSGSEEEDLREDSILSRHQVVLDEMKAKLTLFLEARKRQQDRRKTSMKSK